MRTDQIILRLVALGRLSPAEAERLLMAWNEGRETALLVAGCIALAMMGQLQAHASALASIGHQVGYAVSLVSQALGRVL